MHQGIFIDDIAEVRRGVISTAMDTPAVSDLVRLFRCGSLFVTACAWVGLYEGGCVHVYPGVCMFVHASRTSQMHASILCTFLHFYFRSSLLPSPRHNAVHVSLFLSSHLHPLVV
jgi:hypothetical protein